MRIFNSPPNKNIFKRCASGETAYQTLPANSGTTTFVISGLNFNPTKGYVAYKIQYYSESQIFGASGYGNYNGNAISLDAVVLSSIKGNGISFGSKTASFTALNTTSSPYAVKASWFLSE